MDDKTRTELRGATFRVAGALRERADVRTST
jgi:hypothetical protein